MPQPYPPNVQAELARERNHLAADRSLLSFVRISLTLITVGLGLDDVIGAFRPGGPDAFDWVHMLSLATIGLGVLTIVLATLDYGGEMRRLQQPEYFFTPRWSLGEVTGLLLLGLGLVIFGVMVTRGWA